MCLTRARRSSKPSGSSKSNDEPNSITRGPLDPSFLARAFLRGGRGRRHPGHHPHSLVLLVSPYFSTRPADARKGATPNYLRAHTSFIAAGGGWCHAFYSRLSFCCLIGAAAPACRLFLWFSGIEAAGGAGDEEPRFGYASLTRGQYQRGTFIMSQTDWFFLARSLQLFELSNIMQSVGNARAKNPQDSE